MDDSSAVENAGVGDPRPATRGILAFGLATALLVGILGLRAYQSADLARWPPCPDGPRRAKPVQFHFAAGIEEHRNWIVFPVPEPDATDFVLCLGGHQVAEGIGQTPEGGLVRVSVSTRWVDLMWATGLLGRLERPEPWDLYYTTYRLKS